MEILKKMAALFMKGYDAFSALLRTDTEPEKAILIEDPPSSFESWT